MSHEKILICVILQIVLLSYAIATPTQTKKKEFTTSNYQNYAADISILYSDDKKYLVYRNGNKECYLDDAVVANQTSPDIKNSRTLFVGPKIEPSQSIFKELGEDIINFCNGLTILRLEESPPLLRKNEDKPLTRNRRQITKRTNYSGQTQTQFISFTKDGANNGFAEALSEPEKSQARVSGSIGMGQAQSQSGSGEPCRECITKSEDRGYSDTLSKSHIIHQSPASTLYEVKYPTGSNYIPLKQDTFTPTGISGAKEYPSAIDYPHIGRYPGESVLSSTKIPSVPLPGEHPIAGVGQTYPKDKQQYHEGRESYTAGVEGITGSGRSPSSGQNYPGSIQTYPGEKSYPISGGQSDSTGAHPFPGSEQRYPDVQSSLKSIPGGYQRYPGDEQQFSGSGQSYPGVQDGGQGISEDQRYQGGRQSLQGSGLSYPGKGDQRYLGAESSGKTAFGDQRYPGGTKRLHVNGQSYPDVQGISGGDQRYSGGAQSLPQSGQSYFGKGEGNYPDVHGIPGGDQKYPGGAQSIPGSGQSYLGKGGEQSYLSIQGGGPSISGDQRYLGGTQSLQGSGQTYPDLQSIPGGDQRYPGGVQNLPGIGPSYPGKGGEQRYIGVQGGGQSITGDQRNPGGGQSLQASVPGDHRYPGDAQRFPASGQIYPDAKGIPREDQRYPGSAQSSPGSGQSYTGMGGEQSYLGVQAGAPFITGDRRYPGGAQRFPGSVQSYPGVQGILGGGQKYPGDAQSLPGSGQSFSDVQGIPGIDQRYPGDAQTSFGSGQSYPGIQGIVRGDQRYPNFPESGHSYPGKSGEQSYLGVEGGRQVIHGDQRYPGVQSYPGSGHSYTESGQIYPSQSQSIPGGGQSYPTSRQNYPGGAQSYSETDLGSQTYPGSQYYPDRSSYVGRHPEEFGYPHKSVYPESGYNEPGQTSLGSSTFPIAGGSKGIDVSQGTSITPVDTESGDAESLSSINIKGNSTKAVASSQGKTRNGVAQAQVSGTYTGAFSAQAQTNDNEKGAESQIFGNSTGAISTSQGRAGKSNTQSQIKYSYDTGSTLAEAQGNGRNFNTNSQIQAGVTGGLADAQSSGSGISSSQAQIGFLPYDETKETQKDFFDGGGTASAQSSGLSGQSETQFQGSFQYGVSYTGAAQSSAGKILQNITRPAYNASSFSLTPKSKTKESKNISLIDQNQSTENNTNYSQTPLNNLHIIENTPAQSKESYKTEFPLLLNNTAGNQFNSTIPLWLNEPISMENVIDVNSSTPNTNNVKADVPDLIEELENGDDYYKEHNNKKSISTIANQNNIGQKTPKLVPQPLQTQHAVITSKNHDAFVIRDSSTKLKEDIILQPGQLVPGMNQYKIPPGFRGRITSIAGDKTEANASPGGQAQSQTILLKSGSGKIMIADKIKKPDPDLYFLPNDSTNHQITNRNSNVRKNPYDTYATVTNSETGELNNGENKYSHTYYTKSSTCGYFTFSCNIINGSTGRTKVCRPNPRTHTDGTPC